LASWSEQIDCHEPFAERQLALAKDGAGFDCEVLFAGFAAIPLAATESINLRMSAMRAVLAIGESDRGKMLHTGFFVAEIIGELSEGFELEDVFHSGSRLP
jgi:hypothetical protein